jgi:hypothetical protein
MKAEVELRNAANNYTESCSFDYSIASTENSGDWWRCSGSGYPPEGQRTIDTWMKFNVTDGTLIVNQTWYCNDTDEAGP